jgi:hypothetical protein
MTEAGTERSGVDAAGAALRTPRAAAIAGIAFSVVFTTALVLVHQAVPPATEDAGTWLSDSSRRHSVLLALSLVPFAGIAFLWFIGVVRDRIGAAEDRFFATVFLGSGLLFVAMVFVAAALASGVVATAGAKGGALASSGAWAVSRRVTSELLTIYAMRMAAVFAIATSTILLRTRTAPRWIVATGYAIGLVLLFAISLSAWIELAFPAWVMLLSLHILAAGLKRDTREGPASG